MLLEMTRAAQTGLRKERQYELSSNHLANANTVGFKKEILSFDQMMKARLTTDHSDGDVRLTGNKLDLALRGNGFFKVQTPAGFRYTRNGNFTLNSEGLLVTQKGAPVLGAGGGSISIQGDNVFINEAGGIFVDGEATVNLEVVDFINREELQNEGENLFSFKGNSLDEIVPEEVKVVQGGLETANLSTVYEMTKMIETQRMYETAQKMMRTLDELDTKAISMASQ